MNTTTVEHYFDDIASNSSWNYFLKLCFAGFLRRAVENETSDQSNYNFRVILLK